MSRSSTSNFDAGAAECSPSASDLVLAIRNALARRLGGTLCLRGFRPWGALFAVMLLLAMEGAARLAFRGIAPAGIYASARVQQKIEGLEDALANGPIDVLFLGSSSVDTGIIPSQFDRACRERGLAVVSYNLGFGGPSMSGIYPTLERFMLAKVKPRLVYICLSPNELNAGRLAYVREINDRFETAARMPWSAEWAGRLMSHSYLYAYRCDLNAWLKSGGRKGFENNEHNEAGGFNPRVGIMVNSDDYAYRLGRFAPDAKDLAGLQALCRWCESVGARYVIGEIPLASTSRAVLSAKQQESFQSLLATACRPGETVLGYPDERFSDSCFWDGIHLNEEGAARYTACLAEDAVQRLSSPSR